MKKAFFCLAIFVSFSNLIQAQSEGQFGPRAFSAQLGKTAGASFSFAQPFVGSTNPTEQMFFGVATLSASFLGDSAFSHVSLTGSLHFNPFQNGALTPFAKIGYGVFPNQLLWSVGTKIWVPGTPVVIRPEYQNLGGFKFDLAVSLARYYKDRSGTYPGFELFFGLDHLKAGTRAHAYGGLALLF